MQTIKEKALMLIGQLPEDCTIEDVVYQIRLLAGVEASMRDIEEGCVIPQAEVERRMAEWIASYRRSER
jgi:hypothetical protein